jgi:hypothetical protein
MTRPVILILVGLLLTGCKCQPPTSDPFFGRTTIPPPPTGSSTGQTVAPLYQAPPLVQASPQSPSSVAPPSVQMPGPALSAATPPALQNASPPGIAPFATTPRPTSTLPGPAPAARSAPLASPVGTAPLYAPPGGTFNYRGTSTQGSAPLVPTQPETGGSLPSMVGVSASRTVGPPDDRTPKPVDDTLADGGAAGRKAFVQTIQPRVKDDASSRPINITDLPKADGSSADVRLIQPTGP